MNTPEPTKPDAAQTEPSEAGSVQRLVRRPFGVRCRIVRDNYSGYEVQVWRWWWPVWMQHGFCNTHSSVEKARDYIERVILLEVVQEWPPNAPISDGERGTL